MAYLWCLNQWKKNIDITAQNHKSGLRMHYEKKVDPTVREHLNQFAKWLRQEFLFPLRVNVYVKEVERIRARDGDLVVGTIWRPADYHEYPNIRLATGDYPELIEEMGRDRALLAILHTLAHELTHYYQHINALTLTERGEERQARSYADDIMLEYIEVSGLQYP